MAPIRPLTLGGRPQPVFDSTSGAQPFSNPLIQSNFGYISDAQSSPLLPLHLLSVIPPQTLFSDAFLFIDHSVDNSPNLQQLQQTENAELEKVHNCQQRQRRRTLCNIGSFNPIDPNMHQQKQQFHLDSPMFVSSLWQQQPIQMPRQSPYTVDQLNLLQQQQQNVLDFQQQQLAHPQQLQLITSPLSINPIQLQQQQPLQSLTLTSHMKPDNYKRGICSRRLTQYMYHQQRRPQDNNFTFWKAIATEYFSPNAKKRWCMSLYEGDHQLAGVSLQDMWNCEICKNSPGRGFEANAESLQRLWHIKYSSGTVEEFLYVDVPNESFNSSGQIILEYSKATQESVYKELRVIREGQLRIVFNPDLKICSWDFCFRRHESFIPQRLIVPQISELGAIVYNYRNPTESTSSGFSFHGLQATCHSFVGSARRLSQTLENPEIHELGYTKTFVRHLQIGEVANSLKDLIDYSWEEKRTAPDGDVVLAGPIDGLINLGRGISSSIRPHYQQETQQFGQQHRTMPHNSNLNDQSFSHATVIPHAFGYPASMPAMQQPQRMQSQEDLDEISMQRFLEEFMASATNHTTGLETNSDAGSSAGHGHRSVVFPSVSVSALRSATGNNESETSSTGMNQMLQDPTSVSRQQQRQDKGKGIMED